MKSAEYLIFQQFQIYSLVYLTKHFFVSGGIDDESQGYFAYLITGKQT